MALTAARPLTSRLGDSAIPDLLKLPMKANTKAYQGGMACIDAGYAAPARTATGLLVVGRFERTYNNLGGLAGAIDSEVRTGCFKWINSSNADAIVQADVGKLCYAVDDATVAKTDANGSRSVAGRILALEDDGGIWVLSGPNASEAAAGFEESGEVRAVVTLPINLATVADGVVASFVPGFAGRLIKAQFLNTVAASTSNKLSTLQPRIATVATTGGAMALTTANQTQGSLVQGSAITAANVFTAAQTIDIFASATTAFIEGSGAVLLSLG